MIGNYGVIPEDFEGGKIYASGYVVGEYCSAPSNFRCGGTVDALLREQGIPGIYGVDTRRLTKLLRTRGTMTGRISLSPVWSSEIAAYSMTDAVKNVSVKEIIPGKTDGSCRVAMLDFGYKENIIRELEKRGCQITLFPYDTAAEDIIGFKPDGLMLSNGPGDPSVNTVPVANLRKLLETGIPIFGICLGHQLLALAAGFKSEKLKFGHRGENQPAKDTATGRTYITSQNHGYAIVNDSVDPSAAGLRFINMNDGTCEGLEYKRANAFTVQFHPQGCGGPRDTAFLFDEFVKRMGEYKFENHE